MPRYLGKRNDIDQIHRQVMLDKMRQGARLLIKGLSISETAKRIGISRVSFYNWMRDDAWDEIYRSTSEMLQTRMDDALATTVIGRMKLGAEEALTFQLGVLKDPDAPLPIRTRISDSLMDRDDRMSKKRQLSVKHGHEILNAEVLALAAATAQAMIQAQQQPEPETVIEAEVISDIPEGETAV